MTTVNNNVQLKPEDSQQHYKLSIVWKNVFLMSVLHLMAFYSAYLSFTGHITKTTVVWQMLLGTIVATMGVQMGAHRLWAHRAYKAKWSLRIILMILQTMSLQNHIYEWCRDHRVHHKYSETDADPHNSKRGFFFAHMGWLMVRKHPDVKEKGKNIDMSDLEADPIVMFQKKYYYLLLFIFWAVLPNYLTVYFLNEPLFTSICANVERYVFQLHITWLVNSAAHLYGYRPYDRNIGPTESLVYLLSGEGYHNYHHTFPWDYSASEFGHRDAWNPATMVIDFFAWLGLAYDLKKVDKSTIRKRMVRTGQFDQHRLSNYQNALVNFVWGLFNYTLIVNVTFLMRFIFAPKF